MDNITNEIERSQRWGALAAGFGDAPKHLTDSIDDFALLTGWDLCREALK